MAALYTELVTRRGWLSRERYGLIYALARVTPGTNMLAFSAASAWETLSRRPAVSPGALPSSGGSGGARLLGWRAAMLAVLAMTVPSAVVILLLTEGYQSLHRHPAVMAAIFGALAAAVGMMIAAAWQLVAPQLVRGRRLRSLFIAAGSAALTLFAGLPPVPVLALAAAAGYIWRPVRKS